MDYVYVCRNGDNEELRYSIRTTVANLPPGRIWVVGGKPDWYIGDYIYVEQTGRGYLNVRNQLKAVCLNDEISNDFVLMNDDFFTIKKVEKIEPVHMGTLRETMDVYADSEQKNLGYQRMINITRRVLEKMKINNPLNYELHVPMQMDKKNLLEVIDTQGLWRSMYGNFVGVGGNRESDVKVYSLDKIETKDKDDDLEDLLYISCHDDNFDLIYNEFLKGKYDEPSKYENP